MSEKFSFNIFHDTFQSHKKCYLTVLCILLKNGQTYFKNLVVFTPQDFKSIFDHFSILCMKCLNHIKAFIVILEGLRNGVILCINLTLQCSSYLVTSQLIWSANQLTGFYMRGTLIVKVLIQLV